LRAQGLRSLPPGRTSAAATDGARGATAETLVLTKTGMALGALGVLRSQSPGRTSAAAPGGACGVRAAPQNGAQHA